MNLNPQITGNVGLYYCCYRLLPSEVKQLAHRGEKDGRISFWLQPTDYDQPQFKEAWGRIGHGGLGVQ